MSCCCECKNESEKNEHCVCIYIPTVRVLLSHFLFSRLAEHILLEVTVI